MYLNMKDNTGFSTAHSHHEVSNLHCTSIDQLKMQGQLHVFNCTTR